MTNNHSDPKFALSIARTLPMLQGCSQPEYIVSGSTCHVYRVARQGVPFALKIIDCGADLQKFHRARQEMRTLQALQRCPHIVHLVDAHIYEQEDKHIVFLLQEYVTPFEHSQIPTKEPDVIRLGIQLCDALAACWDAGFAHLDVQPKNLFVTPGGDFRLGDFGTSLPVTELAGCREIRGTLSYMAPEVYHHQAYSQASDLYSLGIILYCLLHKGMLPFADREPKETAIHRRLAGAPLVLSPTVSPGLARCIQQACAYQPVSRFSSFREMRAALAALQPVSPPPMSQRVPFPIMPPVAQIAPIPAMPSTPQRAPAPAPKKAAKKGLTGRLSSLFQKKPSAPPAQPHAPTGFSIPPAPKAASQPAPMPSAPSTPAATPSGNLFDADSLANTCAMMPGNLFDADSAGCTTVLQPPSRAQGIPSPDHAASPRMDQVQFSAVSPKNAIKGEYTLIQVFMYQQNFRNVVQEAMEMMDSPAQEKRSGFHNVRENTCVKIRLTCPDMQIEDNELEQYWSGGYLQFDFAICPPEDFKKRQLLLTAAVYFDGIPATRLMLMLNPQAPAQESIDVKRHDICSAFVSYASQDRPRVGALIQGMRKARPDMDIFFDVNSLRSGEDWEQILYQEIHNRDVLFLCWSRHAKESPWVEREWRYALEQKGSDAIEPIPLEQPDICPPPAELSRKHFNDSLLFIINR